MARFKVGILCDLRMFGLCATAPDSLAAAELCEGMKVSEHVGSPTNMSRVVKGNEGDHLCTGNICDSQGITGPKADPVVTLYSKVTVHELQ